MSRRRNIVWKIALWLVGVLLALVLLVYILIRLPAVQDFARAKAVAFLQEKLGSRVQVGELRITFPKNVLIKDVYLEDLQGDTLFAGDTLLADIGLFNLLRNKLELNRLELNGITAHVTRGPDSLFNFNYILEAFSGGTANPTDPETKPMEISVDRVGLNRFHATYRDSVENMDVAADIGNLLLRMKTFDLQEQNFRASDLALRDAALRYHQGQVTSSPTEASSDSTAPLRLRLDKVQFSHVALDYQTPQMSVEGDVGTFALSDGELDLGIHSMFFNTCTLRNSDVAVTMARVDSVAVPGTATSEVQQATGEDWTIQAGRIDFAENTLSFDDLSQTPATEGVDFAHLKATDLHLLIDEAFYSAELIRAKIASAGFTESSGFRLNTLKANAELDKQKATLSDILMEAGNSRLAGNISAQYSSLDSFQVHPEQARMGIELRDSRIAVPDVLFWAPDLKDNETISQLQNEVITLDADVHGTLDSLVARNLSFSTLKKTEMQVSGYVTGLPDVDRAKFQLHFDRFRSSRTDLSRILPPNTLPDSISLPEEFRITGDVSGTMQRIDADVAVRSSDGSIAVDGVLDLTGSMQFAGKVDMDALELGKILQQDSLLGPVSMNLTADLREITSDRISGSAKGTMDIEFMGYAYQNVRFDASSSAGILKGELSIDDPHLKFTLDADGKQMSGIPFIDFVLNIEKADLRSLGLTPQELHITGDIQGNAEGFNPDSLNATIGIRDLVVKDSARTVTLDTLSLISTASPDSTSLIVQSDFMRLHVFGDYALTKLGPAVLYSINQYYPVASDTLRPPESPQSFALDGYVEYTPLFSQLDSQIHSLAPLNFNGTYNSAGDEIAFEAHTDAIGYSTISIKALDFTASTEAGAVGYNLEWATAQIGDMDILHTTLKGDVDGGAISGVLTVEDLDEKERFIVGLNLASEGDQMVFSLDPESLLLNYKQWTVSPANAITLGQNGIAVRDFELARNDQSLDIRSEPYGVNEPVKISFNNFEIETITGMIQQDSLLAGGVINGVAEADDLFTNPVFTSDLTVTDFNFRGDTVGNIEMKINNRTTGALSAYVHIEGNGNQATLDGDYLIASQSVDLKLRIEELRLASIEGFSAGHLTDGRGALRGDLQVTGKLTAPLVEGALEFDSAGVRITDLKGFYALKNEGIRFSKSDIHFDGFTISDEEQNELTIDGVVYTRTFSDFEFNLDVKSDNFKVLNTTARDNDLYYGTLYLDSRIRVRGGLNQPEIDADIEVLDNTDLTVVIPQTAPGIVEREGVVKFVDLDSPDLDSLIEVDLDTFNTFSLTGLVVFANIKVTDESQFKLIVDQGNGDFLRLKGDAELNASIDPSGKVSLTGNYLLKEGVYELSFNLLKRRFEIRDGSTITWDGEPTSGVLDIKAAYQVDAAPLDLVEKQLSEASAEELNYYKERLPFDLILSLTGILTKPEVSFEIVLPDGNYPVAPEVVTTVQARLEQISRDESEVNKQAFALVLLNRFIADDPFRSASGGTSAESYARQSVSKLLSQQLNNLAADLISGVDLNFDLDSREDYSTGQLQNRTDLNVSASKRLLNDRITISVGSNFELEGTGQANQKASNIAGDVSVEYQLSRDGKYLLKAYRKNEYEVAVEGQVVKTGLSFVIQLDYDEFRELFRKKKKAEEESE